MKYVIDAGIAIKYYVPEIYEDQSVALLEGGHELHIPELLYVEVSSIVWKKVRRGQVARVKGANIIFRILNENWIAHSHKGTLETVYAGAETTGQTVYDFTYLALAISLDCEFVTADEKFYKALENTSFKSNLKWIGDFKDV